MTMMKKPLISKLSTAMGQTGETLLRTVGVSQLGLTGSSVRPQSHRCTSSTSTGALVKGPVSTTVFRSWPTKGFAFCCQSASPNPIDNLNHGSHWGAGDFLDWHKNRRGKNDLNKWQFHQNHMNTNTKVPPSSFDIRFISQARSLPSHNPAPPKRTKITHSPESFLQLRKH